MHYKHKISLNPKLFFPLSLLQVGFTTMSEMMTPEEVMLLLNR